MVISCGKGHHSKESLQVLPAVAALVAHTFGIPVTRLHLARGGGISISRQWLEGTAQYSSRRADASRGDITELAHDVHERLLMARQARWMTLDIELASHVLRTTLDEIAALAFPERICGHLRAQLTALEAYAWAQPPRAWALLVQEALCDVCNLSSAGRSGGALFCALVRRVQRFERECAQIGRASCRGRV